MIYSASGKKGYAIVRSLLEDPTGADMPGALSRTTLGPSQIFSGGKEKSQLRENSACQRGWNRIIFVSCQKQRIGRLMQPVFPMGSAIAGCLRIHQPSLHVLPQLDITSRSYEMHGYCKPFANAPCQITGNISKSSNHSLTPTPVRRAGPDGAGPACPRVRSFCYCTARRALIRPLPE